MPQVLSLEKHVYCSLMMMNNPEKQNLLLAHLLILVGEESLEYFAAGNNWVPAHPGHPALQPLHTHLYKLFLKSP